MISWPDESPPVEAEIEALAAEARRRLGPVAEQPGGWPPVSIVVLNRDGEPHLRRLLRGLAERTDYPDLELIVVDNGSSDGSLDLLRTAEVPFPLEIVANAHNESFSNANNQGAELARGELVLFLNNDVEPCEPGWLRELVACLRAERAGIAGATLLFPRREAPHGFLVQHRAMLFVEESDFLVADMNGAGAEPFGQGFGEDAGSVFPTGACMLIERDLFRRVGGFSPGYAYGGEDIDLGLKVLERGRRVVCSGRSLLIHRFSSTRRKANAGRWRDVGSRNRRVLWERWGARLWREFQLDRLEGGGSWAAPGGSGPPPPSREEALSLSFCLKSSEPAGAEPDGDPLDGLGAELRRRGHRCTVLREEAIDDLVGFSHDVAVHLRGPARYTPRPAQLNVLWVTGDIGAVPGLERDRYDLVLSADDGPQLLVDAVLAHAARLGIPKRIPPTSQSA